VKTISDSGIKEKEKERERSVYYIYILTVSNGGAMREILSIAGDLES